MGESTDEAPYYTVDALPEELQLAPACHAPSRTDLQLGSDTLAFVIDNVLSPEEAQALLELSEAMGYSRFAPGIRTPPGMRRNFAAHWFASDRVAQQFMTPLMERIRDLLPEQIDGTSLHPALSNRIAHYKYEDGDVFNRHTDGAWPGQAINKAGDGLTEWAGLESKLTMLLYLNDADAGVQGGATRIFPNNGAQPVDVAPRTGSALFFRHGFGPDSVHHMGTEVIGRVAKYVVRLNVLYESTDNHLD